jgi:8-oxo-dGTP pyrophosphatase MutT (NUDIX family)
VTRAELEERLREGLSGTLPAVEAQLRMAPRPRPGWRAGILPRDARIAAALLPLFEKQGAIHLLLTLRASTLAQHRGQVSLPGGAVDPGESIERAALREGHEEIGLDPGLVNVLGALTPLHVPVSGFVLYPVVGLCAGTPDLRPSPREVDRILEVPLIELLDPARLRIVERAHEGLAYAVPYFDVCGVEVWGATAMVLAEFLAVIGHPPDPWRSM